MRVITGIEKYRSYWQRRWRRHGLSEARFIGSRAPGESARVQEMRVRPFKESSYGRSGTPLIS